MKRPALYVFYKSVALVFFQLFVPYRVMNAEDIPKSGRVIICCNHPTFKDPTLLTAVAGKRQASFMAKTELLKNPLLGNLFRKVGVLAVNRGKGDFSAISRVQELPQEGRAVDIFIEDARSRDGAFLQPKFGVVMPVFQDNTPILPVCIIGRRGIFPKLSRRVDVACGPLIMSEQLQIEKDSGSEYRQASRLVMNRIMELRGLALVPKALKGEEPQ